MLWIVTLITCGVCALLIIGGKAIARRQVVGSASVEQDRLLAEIRALLDSLEGMAGNTDAYVSKPQFDNLCAQVTSAKANLENEKSSLVSIERNLETAQKSVEGKETAQQEIKSAKEEEEDRLEELLANYAGISEESTHLEHRLAESMKNLDVIMTELKLTADQRSLLEELSKALTQAGSSLRDLLMEYQSVNTRLQNLKQQHADLEDEYTKLVEQQLGE